MFQFVKLLSVTMTFGVPNTYECLNWMAKIGKNPNYDGQIHMDGQNTMAQYGWQKL